RLVAIHFIPNINNKKFVNHIDGNKNNNSVFNLEWVTQSENEKHAFENNLKNKVNKKFKVEYTDGVIKEYENQYLLIEELDVSQTAISEWLSKKKKPNKRHKIHKIYFIE